MQKISAKDRIIGKILHGMKIIDTHVHHRVILPYTGTYSLSTVWIIWRNFSSMTDKHATESTSNWTACPAITPLVDRSLECRLVSVCDKCFCTFSGLPVPVPTPVLLSYHFCSDIISLEVQSWTFKIFLLTLV